MEGVAGGGVTSHLIDRPLRRPLRLLVVPTPLSCPSLLSQFGHDSRNVPGHPRTDYHIPQRVDTMRVRRLMMQQLPQVYDCNNDASAVCLQMHLQQMLFLQIYKKCSSYLSLCFTVLQFQKLTCYVTSYVTQGRLVFFHPPPLWWKVKPRFFFFISRKLKNLFAFKQMEIKSLF